MAQSIPAPQAPVLRRLDSGIVGRRWADPEQLAGTFELRLAGCTSEQAIMTDAVEAPGQHVKLEAPDGLVGASVLTCCRSAPARR